MIETLNNNIFAYFLMIQALGMSVEMIPGKVLNLKLYQLV